MRRNSTRNTDVAAAHLAKMHTEGHIKGFLQSADGVTVNTAIVANRGSDRQLVSGAQLGKNKAGRLRHRRRLVIVVAITGCVILVIVVAVTGCVIPVRRVNARAGRPGGSPSTRNSQQAVFIAASARHSAVQE